ncbi:MAG: hypothetical protein IJ214_04650 [Clostridia bacterium]|nr:hypothetical protein [Clostridia bacterium]
MCEKVKSLKKRKENKGIGKVNPDPNQQRNPSEASSLFPSSHFGFCDEA